MDAMRGTEQLKPYADDAREKGEQVETMFNTIAPTYDTLNHLLSLSIDRLWRRTAARQLQRLCASPPGQVLDVGTGTGDLAIGIHRRTGAHVLGIDISDDMMERGRRKVARAGLSDAITFAHENCEALSLPDDSMDGVASAFALRNFQHLLPCLREMERVLRPGAPVVLIDLCAPRHFPMKQLFALYEHVLIPLAGKLAAGDKRAYTYLPASMRAVLQGADMAAQLQQAGFADVRFRRLLCGMCLMYWAKKQPAPQAGG